MTATEVAAGPVTREGFRPGVRGLLAEPRVRDVVAGIAALPPGEEAGPLPVYRWLGELGWLAPAWPAEYGGLGFGPAEAAIVTEELARAGVPDDIHVLAIDIVGTFLLRVGTARQRAAHLPALARGERTAAVLFTEPECGSDLAALSTRAVPDGDGWRLYGTKTYHQKSGVADIALLAARTTTGPSAMYGITLFLLPLRAPGIHVEPMPGMGNDRFMRVVIDGVRLAAEDVIGDVDDGWRLLNEMLLLERTGIDFHAKARRILDQVIARADASGRLDDPRYALALADLDARLRAGHALAWEQVRRVESGSPDQVSSAMAKWYVTEQIRALLHVGTDVAGLDAMLTSWDGQAPDDGAFEAAYRLGPAHRLASGTSEIMLYLIATNGLELL
jgi:alkylation response protein AidB-like acyl-CoA dehydrogenase